MVSRAQTQAQTCVEPEACPRCGERGRVVESRRVGRVQRGVGYRRRRHECPGCRHRWTTYQSVVNPNEIHSAAPGNTSVTS